jgi:L-fuculose-phosphate aldolase
MKSEIVRVMKSLYSRGLVSAIGGNVSARKPGSQEVWITPSGFFKGNLSPKDLVKIDLDGKVLYGKKPSKEWVMHTAVYKKRGDINAVVHSHNPLTVALNLSGLEFRPPNIEAAAILKNVPVIPFQVPGTDKLGKEVFRKAGKAQAIILKNHGILALGRDLVEAEAIAEIMEETSLIILVSFLAGKYPKGIPKNLVSLTRKLHGI